MTQPPAGYDTPIPESIFTPDTVETRLGPLEFFDGLPTAPDGKEANWIQTVEGKGWFILLRLYGPLESWFDQTWRPGELTLES